MVYKDSSKSVNERVEDLIQRMTIQEKVAQLTCALTIGGTDNRDSLKESLKEGIGTLSYLNSSLTGNNEKDIDTLNFYQQYLVNETRLGIPALVHNEGIAGAQIPGATTFPQSLNVASTWEPELAERMGEAVRKQLLGYGVRAVHSPLFDLGRDPRWGRIGETYGEDPYLVGTMGTSYVKGIQGNEEFMAVAKHFVAYGNTEGGRNGGEQQIGERKLLDTYCYPFEAAIHEGKVMGIMNSYGILNEQAVSTSKWLLTDILRDKLGFSGVVVADYGSVSHANVRYRVAKTQKDTAVMALKAGLDVEQPSSVCYQYLVEAVREGELEESYVDNAVRRILEVKFKLGLFEQPYAVGDFFEEIKDEKYRKLSLEIAEKSMVLVKNEDNILPIINSSTHKLKIAVIGPSADTKANFFGGYSSVGTASATTGDFDRSEQDNYLKAAYATIITEYKGVLAKRGIIFDKEPSPEQKIMILSDLKKSMAKSNKRYKSVEEFIENYYPDCNSVKELLEQEFGEENVVYAKGCNINSSIEGGLSQVKEVVEQAELVIAVLGGKESMRATDATAGENKDNCNIDLEKAQIEMMEEVFRLNKPVIAILVDGRPLATPFLCKHSKAVLYSFLPAQTGAEAIIHILTGKTNPSGKLPVTILKDKGQIPMYYSRLPFYVEMNDWAEYIDHDKNVPLYPFGYGLSYTKFEYKNLNHNAEVKPNEKLELDFQITNVGERDGDEIVQIYIRDCMSSIARPTKQLVGYKRVSLKAKETKGVLFEIDMKQLAFHDMNMNQVIEPGKMELYVGASSQDIRLQGEFNIVGDLMRVERKAFVSKTTIY